MTVNEFIAQLPKVSERRMRWHITHEGKIKSKSGYNLIVGFYRALRRGSLGNVKVVDELGVARVLKLVTPFAQIFMAANNMDGHDPKLRRKLLGVLGLRDTKQNSRRS